MRPPTILIPVSYTSCPPQTCIITHRSLSIWRYSLLLHFLLHMILPHIVVHTHTHTHLFCWMTHSKKTQAWKGSLSISTSFSVSMLPHSFSWHTHTRSLFLPHTHTYTQDTHRYTHPACTHQYSPCHQLPTQKLINTDASATTGASRPLWRANTIKQSVRH